MAISLLPSAEQMAVSLLSDHPDGTWAGRVSTDLPANPVMPAIRVERGGGAADPVPYWIDRPLVYIHTYGRTQDEAETAARRAHAILHASEGQHIAGVGTVTAVNDVQGVVRIPDADVPDAERYLFSTSLTTHP